MKIISPWLKRLSFCSFLAGLVFLLNTCGPFPQLFDTVTINGTVSITRKGTPWTPDHINFFENMNTQTYMDKTGAARSSPPAPPYNRPRLYAYTSPDKENFIVSSDADLPDNINLALGKYSWTMEIPSYRIPGLLYFEIEIPMAGLSPEKMTVGIRVENNNSVIDLGVIDFDVIRLWGNLPVTFNGELSTANVYSRLFRSPYIDIKLADGSYLGGPDVESNGNWLQDIYSQDVEKPVTFILKARENGGIFSKVLNHDNDITVHKTDKEIIFPDYPSIDFKAFLLSGTIDIVVPDDKKMSSGKELNWCVIEFYDADYNSLIGLVDDFHPRKNENGLFEWETMVPAFSFPVELLFKVQYKTNSGILLTEDTDLRNIHLGTFPDYY
jgi:hypothetical protein